MNVKAVCQTCQCEFDVRADRVKTKFCSRKCFGLYMRSRQRKIQPEKTCGVCGNTFRHHKNKFCSRACSRKDQSERQKGVNPHLFADPEKFRASLRTDEHRQRCSRTHRGAVRTTPNSRALSATHSSAAVFFVKSPANVTYLVMNIVKFVFENEHLFPPESVKWKWFGKSRHCNASSGLHQIYRGHRGTWRGWMVVGRTEGRENIDLLPRSLVTAEKGGR